MNQGMPKISNPFYSPILDIVIKGVEEDGKWIVYLQASNEMLDQDGEIIDMSALQKAKDYFLSHGVLSWDHKHKATHDPKYIIGEPLEVQFTNTRETLVKGFLYKANDIAQNVWKNLQSGARLGASVGGGILQKSENAIKEVIWDETAITHKPINDGTLGNVQMVPFAVFAKALTAGGGVDASTFTGGRALTHESLQGNPSDTVPPPEELKGLFGDLLKAVRNHKITTYNDMLNFVYDRGYEGNSAAKIINYLTRKIPNVVGKGK